MLISTAIVIIGIIIGVVGIIAVIAVIAVIAIIGIIWVIRVHGTIVRHGGDRSLNRRPPGGIRWG